MKIAEYAIVDKDLKKVPQESLTKTHFSLLGQETYKSKTILDSISSGNAALIGALRTHNIFPIRPYARKIAETIKELYRLPAGGTVELYFDDIDLIAVEREAD